MIECVPREWFDSTNEKLNFFMIAELGFIKPTERAVALDRVTGMMWPLVNDSSQIHLISEGPWLVQVDLDRLEQADISTLADASHAWIAAYSEGGQLSRQFTPAMCCISPAQEVRLLRFYCPEIIKTLKNQAEYSWFDELFANLESWHWRSENGKFQLAFESPLTTKSGKPDKWTLKVDEDLWFELVGNPEIEVLISCLAKDAPEVFEGLKGSAKRRMVRNCLAKADALGVRAADDRKVYVYLEMVTGNKAESSDEISELTKRAVGMQKPLVELLDSLIEQGNK
ncbi:DUF4123 domain-containing protein [Marinobacter sp. HL-58]|uniref:DUF4123 domain-containing protein n=1 Tax=Marinobacter sp. HL-58 TaxID=1479237 RepID=UPI0004854B24|nr:DUF4123 domain-containing protein [Marinobacter sp. HL-58]KPP97869.1 MAG: protein of unknown function containing DUF4123 domain [Marinobacter sp. HL-58]